MYKNELLSRLNSNNLPNSILFCGDDYFIDYYSDIVLSKIKELEVFKLYYDEYNYSYAYKLLSENSLFSSGTILQIKTDKVIPKLELNSLIECCSKNVNNHFYLSYYGSNHKKLAPLFSPKKNSDFVRFFKPNFIEVKALLQSKSKDLGLLIDDSAINVLITNFFLDIGLIVKELEKLSLLEQKIGVNELKDYTYSLSMLSLDDFYFSILEGREYIGSLNSLIDSGEDEIRVFNGFMNFISMLWTFKLYIKLNGALDSKDILGYKLPKDLEQERLRLAMKYKDDFYINIFREQFNYELLLKSTKGSKNSLLISFFLKVSSFL